MGGMLQWGACCSGGQREWQGHDPGPELAWGCWTTVGTPHPCQPGPNRGPLPVSPKHTHPRFAILTTLCMSVSRFPVCQPKICVHKHRNCLCVKIINHHKVAGLTLHETCKLKNKQWAARPLGGFHSSNRPWPWALFVCISISFIVCNLRSHNSLPCKLMSFSIVTDFCNHHR